MHYIVYKVTNKINGKIYVGVHKTKKIYDNYLGSGKLIRYAIQKYGKDNFMKEILFDFDNEEDMMFMEQKIVDEKFVESEETYNIIVGGNKSSRNFVNCMTHETHVAGGKAAQAKMKFLRESNPVWCAAEKERKIKQGKLLSSVYKQKIKECEQYIYTAVDKQRMSEQKQGSKNPNFGKIYIHNLEEKKSISVKKEELEQWITKGWSVGRKMKF